jgi:YCII-related domain
MPKYIIAYRGEPKFESPQQGAAHMAKWKAWIGGLGDAVVNPGTPLAKGKSISSGVISDIGANRLNGFSMIMADNLDAALELAKGCPFVDHGTIEVAEVMEMK